MTESYGTITITDTTDLEWFYGTDLTHTSGTAVANIIGAAVGSMYLNTQTSLAYKCTAVAANGDQTWQYIGNMASGALEAVQEAIDNIEIGGRNLIHNLATINLINNYTRPNINGDTDSYIFGLSTGTITESVSGHGIRHTVTGATKPGLNFGTRTTADMGMYGLKAGETYTWSFDWKAKNLSGSPSDTTNYYMRAYCAYTLDNSTNKVDLYKTFYTYSKDNRGDRGQEISGSGSWTFTIPDNAKGIWLQFSCNSSTNSFYAANDYVEIYNIKLENGNKATDWTSAPEDTEAIINEAQANLSNNAERLDQISNNIDQTNEKLNLFNENIGASLISLQDSLRTISDTIVIDPNETSPSITIVAGTEGSNACVRIEKDRISFNKTETVDLDGDETTTDDLAAITSEVLYISSQEEQGTIHINTAKIDKSIRIGNLEIFQYDHGIAVRRY